MTAAERLKEWAHGVLETHAKIHAGGERWICGECAGSQHGAADWPCDARRGALMVQGLLMDLDPRKSATVSFAFQAMAQHLPPAEPK